MEQRTGPLKWTYHPTSALSAKRNRSIDTTLLWGNYVFIYIMWILQLEEF